MEEKLLIGANSFNSKKGEDCYMLHFVGDTSPFERSHGHKSTKKCEQVFVNKEVYDTITDDMFGKEVVCTYSFSGYKAYLIDVKLKK